MSRFLSTGTLLLAVIYLAGCETENPKPKQNKYGYHPKPATTVYQEETPATTDTTQSTTPTDDTSQHTEVKKDNTTASTTTTTTTTAPQPKKGDYPYATPVPNKPGFVTSPHAPYAGYVDVRGFPPGTEVKDPYTGKIFLVP